jgi:hypothetical protein
LCFFYFYSFGKKRNHEEREITFPQSDSWIIISVLNTVQMGKNHSYMTYSLYGTCIYPLPTRGLIWLRGLHRLAHALQRRWV